MPPKPRRFRSEGNLKRTRDMPCTACGKPPPSDPAHVKSRGSGGGDHLFNLLPLCRKCHSTSHSFGWYKFARKYPAVCFALYHRNWEFIGRRLVRDVGLGERGVRAPLWEKDDVE